MLVVTLAIYMPALEILSIPLYLVSEQITCTKMDMSIFTLPPIGHPPLQN